jgi:hypothetical protein
LETSLAIPTSMTSTSMPWLAAMTEEAAFPAAIVAKMEAVTADGKEVTFSATTPWSPAKTSRRA